MSKDKISEIGLALERAVKDDCEKNINVSFSGGIDSALVAFLASKYTNVELITVGVKDSHDIEAAKTLCKNTDTAISRMIEKGVDRIDKPMTDISAAIENQAKSFGNTLDYSGIRYY